MSEQSEGWVRICPRAPLWGRVLRVTTAIGFAFILLFLWHKAARGSNHLPPPLPSVQVEEDSALRPAVIIASPHGPPRAVWRAPTIGHISPPVRDGPLLHFTWTPTGAATDSCAISITIHLTTRAIFTSSIPTCISSPKYPIPNTQYPISNTSTFSFALQHQSAGNVLLPPPIIRVYHDPRNTCRDALPGQVDILPFEEYVARVVPAEMPASWPMEALKAQAITVRTYAWHHILRGRPDWDVSDWSNFQVMCDRRHPRSDAAVAATRGQALVFEGLPILALYSAQNGHPTLDDPWGLPYLSPVPDPVSLGAPRSGHGLGLSQYGAKAWAERGWNAYQVLAHYYPGVGLSVPPDTSAVVGTLLPLELENMTLGRGYPLYAFFASPRPLAALTITAQTEDNRLLVVTRTAPVSPFLGVWLPPSELTSAHPITLTASVVDRAGISGTLGQAVVWRDLRPLTVTLHTVTETVDRRLPFTVSTRIPRDMAFSLGVSDNWIWEEKDFRVSPLGIGQVVTDEQALDGWAWEHPRGGTAAILYGPYTDDLEPERAYRAWFRLRVDDASSPEVVVFLDVVDDAGQTLLGMRALRGIEFPGSGIYREYPVDFYLAPRNENRAHQVEFRVHATGKVTLRLDRVLVTTYPQSWGETSRWIVPQKGGPHALVAKATTRSGVVGSDVPLSVTLHAPEFPLTVTLPPYAGWISQPIPLSAYVTTTVSPPNVEKFMYRYAQPGARWSPWQPIGGTLVSTRTAKAFVPISYLPDGEAVRVQVRGEDTFAYRTTSTPITLSVDLSPPTLHLLPWQKGVVPTTVVVRAADNGIGVRDMEIVVTKVNTPPRRHTISLAKPVPVLTYTVTLTETGTYTLSILARDALEKTTRYTQTFHVQFPRRILIPLLSVR